MNTNFIYATYIFHPKRLSKFKGNTIMKCISYICLKFGA